MAAFQTFFQPPATVSHIDSRFTDCIIFPLGLSLITNLLPFLLIRSCILPSLMNKFIFILFVYLGSQITWDQTAAKDFSSCGSSVLGFFCHRWHNSVLSRWFLGKYQSVGVCVRLTEKEHAQSDNYMTSQQWTTYGIERLWNAVLGK